jgi:hypothetical protein
VNRREKFIWLLAVVATFLLVQFAGTLIEELPKLIAAMK